jgi:hypothetical protein
MVKLCDLEVGDGDFCNLETCPGGFECVAKTRLSDTSGRMSSEVTTIVSCIQQRLKSRLVRTKEHFTDFSHISQIVPTYLETPDNFHHEVPLRAICALGDDYSTRPSQINHSCYRDSRSFLFLYCPQEHLNQAFNHLVAIVTSILGV